MESNYAYATLQNHLLGYKGRNVILPIKIYLRQNPVKRGNLEIQKQAELSGMKLCILNMAKPPVERKMKEPDLSKQELLMKKWGKISGYPTACFHSKLSGKKQPHSPIEQTQ